MTFLDLKTWDENAGIVYKEIVNRFGMEDYQNETTRKTHIATLKAEYDAKQYARQRVTEYPDIGDQLDMIWHLIDSGGTLDKTSDFYTSIKVVKDAHPKS